MAAVVTTRCFFLPLCRLRLLASSTAAMAEATIWHSGGIDFRSPVGLWGIGRGEVVGMAVVG